MDPSNYLPPSHNLLHYLGELRNFNKNEMLQLILYLGSIDSKVQDQSKSVFERWQKPGLLSLPSLLDRAIRELKLEFDQCNPGNPQLRDTLKELDVAYEG